MRVIRECEPKARAHARSAAGRAVRSRTSPGSASAASNRGLRSWSCGNAPDELAKRDGREQHQPDRERARGRERVVRREGRRARRVATASGVGEPERGSHAGDLDGVPRSSSRTATSASIASSLIAGSGSWWLNLAHSKRSVRRRTDGRARVEGEERALEVLERRLCRSPWQSGSRRAPSPCGRTPRRSRGAGRGRRAGRRANRRAPSATRCSALATSQRRSAWTRSRDFARA